MIDLMRDPATRGPEIRTGLQALIDSLPGGAMYEIGSYAGESAEMFAKHFGEVHCVDPWEGLQFHVPGDDEVEQEFDRRARSLSNVKKHKGRSVLVSKTVPDRSLDFVYIDADHSFSAVIDDLAAWWPKVKIGGSIGGHDFLPDDFEWTGVARAVRMFFPRGEIILYSDSSWKIGWGKEERYA
jgi:cephalosporin hydroxylase